MCISVCGACVWTVSVILCDVYFSPSTLGKAQLYVSYVVGVDVKSRKQN